ncbi:1,4-alpha-glucan branching protein GlgB [uncultured Ruminococcus sp.]|uniref:1,4-alpha-glucan branching protein GlgB n=1 Tax=uncultured Ruminococcus sp. TaxID=165186 RepID=UPI0025CCB028|nr:1,4-alpha-glucan branching protein GlgB [uncultured Ruminococcus sp.]
MAKKDFLQGQSCTAYDDFGAKIDKNGVTFTTYAPHAANVKLLYNDAEYQMTKDSNGAWEVYVEGACEGGIYQYAITNHTFQTYVRSDPFAFYSQVRPQTASVVYNIDDYSWKDSEWIESRDKCYEKPMNIYEVHFGSWRTKFDSEEDDRLYSYDEMIDLLIPYVKDMGYTHIELMPIMEYPFDGSWGYQVTGYFSATSRYGEPRGLMRFIDACHNAGIGVILDFVPVHFVTDFYALHMYDGGFLFESDYEDQRYSEWGTALFDYTKPHVLSFIKSSINFWIEKYHADGIRYDAVAYLIYKYGRKENPINDSGIWFLKNTNYAIQKMHPDVMLFAEDSTDYEKVTAPVEFGGLGFDYKWDLGYMNDTINYVKTPPFERGKHHNKMTFSMSYFYNNLYILPYSHDEVVHGKQTMLDKCFGTHEEKIATIKALYTFQFTHPGKKLNFMGNELGEYMEWRYYKELGWNLLAYPSHDSLHEYLKKLHHIYLNEPSLFKYDYNSSSFRWIDANNNRQSIFAFQRNDLNGNKLYMVFNFSGAKQRYDLHVDENCHYEEILNSDRDIYAGSNCLNNNLNSFNYTLPLNLAACSCTIIKKA